jgi:CRP/FNR family transcriptional regulator, polysaccharide utilization system transcription regulator
MSNYIHKLNCAVCNHKPQCFFNGMTDSEYDLLYANKKEIDYKAGEMIYKQGTESKYLIFLLSGMAKVYIEGDNKKNFILELVKPFQFIDIPSIFDDDMLYRSSAAVVDSRACMVDLQAFKSIILGSKNNIPRLVKHFNHTQNRYSDRLTNVIYKNMEARIADAFLYLVNEIYFSRVFTLNLSRSDLADLAGMSRESTSRIISQFREQEILKVAGKKVEILDKKQLEQIARYG